MSFVQREIDRIRARKVEVLNEGEGGGGEYSKLAAADQALSWALDPTAYMAPADFAAGRHAGGGGDSAQGCGLTPGPLYGGRDG